MYTLQSTSKPFNYAIALDLYGADYVNQVNILKFKIKEILFHISLNCPLRKIWSLKNTEGEKTTRHLKTSHPITFLDSLNCAQISSE